MTLPQKAVLLDLRVFLADNNLRRNTSAFSVNYGSVADDVSMNSFSLGPTVSKTLTPPNPCAVTVLRTSAQVVVSTTLRPANVGDPPKVNTFTVTQLFVIDTDIESITVTNPSATVTAKVIVQQG